MKLTVKRPYPPSLLLKPVGSRDRNGSVTITELGPVSRVPFDGGQAFFVEEGTTNLIPNPSFEIDLSGWVAAGDPNSVTIARDATQSIDGTASLRVDVDGSSGAQGTIIESNQVEISPSTTYTLSAFVKAPAGVEFQLGGNLYNGAAWIRNFSVKSFVGTGSWERIVNTRTLASTPLDTIRPFVRTVSSGLATTFWVDGVQLEAKPYATSFTHGDMGEGYSWTGTPHNSPSVRQAAKITVPMPDEPSSMYYRYSLDGEEWHNAYTEFANGVDEDIEPILLLRPEGSYSWTPEDGVQEATPTITGNVQVVDGQYGQAWRNQVAGTPGVIEHPSGVLVPQQGTMLIRLKHPIENAVYPWRIGNQNLGSTQTLFGARMTTTDFRLRTTGSVTGGWTATASATPTPDAWYVTALRWTPDTISIDFGTGDGWKSVPRAEDPSLPFTTPIRLGSWLVTSANRLSTIDIEAALFFDTPLTDDEIQRISTMDEAWTWRNTGLIERMVDTDIEFDVPDFESGISIIETKVYASDMFGAVGRDVPITDARMTSDIDRAGSKTRIELETVSIDPADKYSIGPGRWVTVFQEISRENAGTERVRRGTFELGQPTVSSKGNRDHVQNSGNDIVDRLQRASVLDTFYTPVRGFIMRDVELAIRMLGITSMGANVVSNHSFENELTGWATGGSGTASFVAWTSGSGFAWPAPDGIKVGSAYVPSGEPSSHSSWYMQDISLPSGTKKVFVSAFVYAYNGTELDGAVTLTIQGDDGPTYATTDYVSLANGYNRLYFTADIPDQYTSISLRLMQSPNVATMSSAHRLLWDDVQVRPITGDLLPESVLALPQSTTWSTNRIQHLPGATLLEAVNDRLAALGMMAVNATPDNKFTSRRSRDTATDEVVRTFHLNEDVRMIGDVTVERSVTSMYNRVFAIKEDFTSGEAMIAMAENTDPNDPWSIHNILLQPKIVTSQDAANLQVLQDLAEAELARASVQTSIKFGILPDPALTVYDMIYIDGPPGHRAVGRWAIESIESGLTTDNPLMIIGARRSTR